MSIDVTVAVTTHVFSIERCVLLQGAEERASSCRLHGFLGLYKANLMALFGDTFRIWLHGCFQTWAKPPGDAGAIVALAGPGAGSQETPGKLPRNR